MTVTTRPRIVLAASLALILGLSAIAYGQIAAARPRHFEYLHQEVLTSALTQTMNDLDVQGWEIFQVVPVWQIKNENAETLLAPKSYEIFGRRAIAPK